MPSTHCQNGHEYLGTSFSLRKDGSRQCRICVRARSRKWRENNKLLVLYNDLWSRYRLPRERFNALLLRQNYRCVCGELFTEPDNRPHVDHDHACCPGRKSCGKCVRGLLCSRCNVALGMLGDNLERFKILVGYLKRKKVPECPNVLRS